MLFLGRAGASEEVIKDVEAALSRGDRCYSAAFEAVIEELTTDEGGMKGGGCVILQFEEEAGFGCGWSCYGLGSGESVKYKGGV